MNYESEKREAFIAGNKALESLGRAKEELEKAKGWGIFDILGGGMVASLIKRDKMSKAKTLLDRAFNDVRAFDRELEDINIYEFPDIETDDFLTAADLFFDNMFADVMVQNRIEEAINKVDTTMYKIESILHRLY